MDRARYARQGETLIEWSASALLAAATGWAAATIGQSMMIGIAVLAAMLPAGAYVLKRAGGPADVALNLPEFAPEPIESAADGELLLDDPLVPASPDSRVASLFDTNLAIGAETPGAMVTRIADYLGDQAPRNRAMPEHRHEQGPEDAGAALHRALANIRASLR